MFSPFHRRRSSALIIIIVSGFIACGGNSRATTPVDPGGGPPAPPAGNGGGSSGSYISTGFESGTLTGSGLEWVAYESGSVRWFIDGARPKNGSRSAAIHYSANGWSQPDDINISLQAANIPYHSSVYWAAWVYFHKGTTPANAQRKIWYVNSGQTVHSTLTSFETPEYAPHWRLSFIAQTNSSRVERYNYRRSLEFGRWYRFETLYQYGSSLGADKATLWLDGVDISSEFDGNSACPQAGCLTNIRLRDNLDEGVRKLEFGTQLDTYSNSREADEWRYIDDVVVAWSRPN